MAIIISDVHGCYKTLLALLDKVPKNEKIIFTGDLIDRGPQSKEVIQLVRDNNFLVVLGNHEDFMTGQGCYGWDSWFRNGADATLKSYGVSYCKRFSSGYIDKEDTSEESYQIFKEHQSWMLTLPVYLLFEDEVNDDGEKLLVSHSSVAKVWKWSEKRRSDMHHLFKEHIIWERNYNPKPISGIYNVIGHTVVEEPSLKKGVAFIDTGAAYKRKLTALRFPQMEIYQQEYIE